MEKAGTEAVALIPNTWCVAKGRAANRVPLTPVAFFTISIPITVMTLDTSNFECATQQMQKSLEYLESDASRADPELRKQFRAALIQAFEFTYELGVKMIRRQLEQIVPNPAELRGMAFMDLMRTAADAGLLRDAAPFKAYREIRNITSHAYDETRAEEVVAVASTFLVDMRFALAELQKRNREVD